MSAARLDSVVLGSSDPDRLAAWYRSAFAPGTDEQGPVVALDHGSVVVDARDDVAAEAREPGRVIVNIQVDDIATTRDHLDTQGVTWIRPIDRFGLGLIATVEDADHNLVNVFQKD